MLPKTPTLPERRPRKTRLSRCETFRQALYEPGLTLLMEAHNGLSARIVEETGFRGIWASGLSISASCGVRDCNEISWTQVMEIVECMTDVTQIPILVDADTGYGNFNNFRRLVYKLAMRNVAAVCIEDKTFPKANSFRGENQPLISIEEFCGKLQAGKDQATVNGLCIVARTEALVSGLGMSEALDRASAYQEAGADAILVHSKEKTADQVLAFARRWDGHCPLVVVPTTYSQTPLDELEKAGIAMAICANHNLRASIRAMREISRQILQERSLGSVESQITPLADVFRLTRTEELEAAERMYTRQPRKVPAFRRHQESRVLVERS